MEWTMLTKFLAPFLPGLIHLGSQASEEAAKKLGTAVESDVWEKAKAVWLKLRPKLQEKPAALEAAEALAATPDDENWQKMHWDRRLI